jgi:anti-sigma B factor antagonist
MGSVPQFEARTEARNGVARVAMAGELDMVTVPILTKELALVEQDGVGAIMLDLRDVSFVDSSGLHALLQAHQRAKSNGHRLILIGASPSTRRLFAMTETEFLLDEQEAVTLLGQFSARGRRDDPMEFVEIDFDG